MLTPNSFWGPPIPKWIYPTMKVIFQGPTSGPLPSAIRFLANWERPILAMAPKSLKSFPWGILLSVSATVFCQWVKTILFCQGDGTATPGWILYFWHILGIERKKTVVNFLQCAGDCTRWFWKSLPVLWFSNSNYRVARSLVCAVREMEGFLGVRGACNVHMIYWHHAEVRWLCQWHHAGHSDLRAKLC